MALEITGKLIKKLDKQTGTGARGEWNRQDIILETNEQYPKTVCIEFWNDAIKDIEKLNLGETVTVSININSREFNGKWYTSVRAWRIQAGAAGKSQQNTAANQDTASAGAASSPPSYEPLTSTDAEVDDLPF